MPLVASPRVDAQTSLATRRGLALWPLALVVLLALALRAGIVATGHTDAAPRTWESDVLARNVLAGHGFVFQHINTEYRAFQQPLGVYVLAAALGASGYSYLAVYAVQSLFSMALVTLTWVLARRVVGERPAMLAAALVAFHPGYVFYDTNNVASLSLDSFLFVLSVLAILLLGDRPTAGRAVAAGAAMGLSALSRGTIWFALPIALVWLGLARRLSPRHLATIGLLMIASVAILVGPWLARSYIVMGRPVMLSTTAELLWRGNNPNSTGTGFDQSGRTQFDLNPDFMQTIYGRTEAEQYDRFLQAAIEYIEQDPAAFLARTARKLFYFWWFSPQTGLLYPPSYLLVYQAVYVGFIALAAYGAVRMGLSGNRRAWHAVLLILSFAFAVSLFQSLFYVEGRHRWGIEPLLLVLSACGAVDALNRLRRLLP